MGDYKSDRWVNGEKQFRGRIALIRKNVSLQSVKKSDYPELLLVTLVFHQVTPEGLPSSGAELDRLDNTEEVIADQVCSRYDAQFAMCVTTNGTRDLFFFLPSLPTEKELAKAIDACEPAVDYDFTLHHDPNWKPYVTMLPDSKRGSSRSESPWWKRLLGLS